jgi:hypothetical protein
VEALKALKALKALEALKALKVLPALSLYGRDPSLRLIRVSSSFVLSSSSFSV